MRRSCRVENTVFGGVQFPVDTLKIDQSFVHRINTSGSDAPIVTAVIAMARSLNLRVVGEGVETPEEVEFLRAHHCDEAQGHYFSRPLPSGLFAKLLETGIPKTRRPLSDGRPLSAALAKRQSTYAEYSLQKR
jgi:predicted signal transduction protein with EAL and GGDEF domain